MPYLFAFLVAANAVFMGYHLLQAEKNAGNLPSAIEQYYPDASKPLALKPIADPD
ncbi:MAG: hypothetical protein VXW65_11125 [Pseudomonadota bacterium]|nr:hypothetical protein [Pseudomonadota bacterium]